MKLALLILKNLRRNPIRTTLTCLATMVMVFLVVFVFTALWFIDNLLIQKGRGAKAVVTEKWQIPSQLPMAYAPSLAEGAARSPRDVRPQNNMTWQFYLGTIDPAKRTRENRFIAIALDPTKIPEMIDELADIDPKLIEKMLTNQQGVLVGGNRLKMLNRQVGDRISVWGISYAGIDLEFEIIGTLPPGKFERLCFMNRDYLNNSLDVFPRTHGGRKHPRAENSLAVMHLQVEEAEDIQKLSQQITLSGQYSNPAVKVESAGAEINRQLAPFKDLIWGMKWLLRPAILITMTLVVANAISITVRERQTEMAILKVLGFRPQQLLLLVLGESLFLGAGSGFLSAFISYCVFTLGQVSLPLSIFPQFYIPPVALAWGAITGGVTALLGGLMPAYAAAKVKPTDVFARVV